MRIRRAVASDLATAASISVSALSTDELYRYTNPYAGQEPSSFRDFLLRRLKLRNVLPGYIIWVAVTDDVEDLKEGAPNRELGSETGRRGKRPREQVIGYAVWYRHGKSAEAGRWQMQSWAECKIGTFAGIPLSTSSLTCYVNFFQLDKSVSPSRMRELGALGFLTEEFADIAERWHLQGLVVDPMYQRRGVGARLISWGVQQAELENVPITLTTSTIAEPLYRKLGFKTYRLTDVPGIRMGLPSLIRWPSGSHEGEAGSRKE
ncbi:MAG: hypothetical protein Q9226_006233 [Calogaya cf. arnoldii]